MRIKSKGLTLHIDYDDDPFNPREDDNLGLMLCWHRRYNLGDKHDYETPQDFFEDKELQDSIVHKMPVYLYDHSGLSISPVPFNDRFDSGQLGVFVLTKDKVIENYGEFNEDTLLKAKCELANEFQRYQYYIEGTHYEFMIEDEDGDIIESCGNFSGDTFQSVLEEMKNCSDDIFSHLFDKAIQKQAQAEM